MTSLAAVLGGLVVLVVGGELLVRGASSLARAIGMSPLVVGLTVVAFATSAPELAVTVQSSLTGSPDLAIGNVVGSNIVNILLILGASALILPLTAKSQLVRTDIPIMIGLSVALLVVASGGRIERLEAALLLAALAAYVLYTVWASRREPPLQAVPSTAPDAVEHLAEELDTPVRPAPAVLLVVAGVALLIVGAQLLVLGATDIAESLGISELVIGLTVVAIGTSLPELATSIIAAVKGERDLALGNIVGSNIFNIGAVLGVAGVAAGPLPVTSSATSFDIPVMILAAVILLPMAVSGGVIGRLEGAFLVASYTAYTAYLLLDSTGHDALEPFSAVMRYFVVPAALLLFTLGAVTSVRNARRRVGDT